VVVVAASQTVTTGPKPMARFMDEKLELTLEDDIVPVKSTTFNCPSFCLV